MVPTNGAVTKPKRPKKRRCRRSSATNGHAKAQKAAETSAPPSDANPPKNAHENVENAPPPASASVTPATGEEIGTIESSLHSNGIRSANLVLRLIASVTPEGADTVRAIHATRRSLASLSKAGAADDTFRAWLDARRGEFTTQLCAVIAHADAPAEARESAVAVAAVAGGQPWEAVVKSALSAEDAAAADVVGECFVGRYADLRLAALKVVSDGAGEPTRRLSMLAHCETPAAEESILQAGEPVSKRAMRKAFSGAWLRLLRDARGGSLCAALSALPSALPHFSRPLDVADFLKSLYSGGSASDVTIAALDPLFVLISRHGLDYPLFYPKLYGLLTPHVLFHSAGRERFLEMAAMFLRFGEFVPGGMIAAFVKRLARRSLTAPPAGAMWCLRLALDLLHRHPAVSFLVHRSTTLFDSPPSVASSDSKKVAAYAGADPFDDSEPDPQASRAEESSLWELDALRNHVSPAVSRLVLAFSKDVRKKALPPPGDVGDYAGLRFGEVFEAEFRRKAKRTPVAYDAPGKAPGVKEVGEDVAGAVCWR